jgi:hypothetical protein
VDVAVVRYLHSHNEDSSDVKLIRDGKEYTYEDALKLMEDVDGE